MSSSSFRWIGRATGLSGKRRFESRWGHGRSVVARDGMGASPDAVWLDADNNLGGNEVPHVSLSWCDWAHGDHLA